MKHAKNSGWLKLFISYRQLLLTAFVFISINFTSYVYASGAKMPAIQEGTSTTSTTETPGVKTEVPPPPKEIPTQTTQTTPTITISENYSHLDPSNIVPKALLTKALAYFDANKSQIKNQEVIGIIDFSQHNSKERFYIIDMQSGHVETYQVAHGKNSDPDYDGYATKFSNEPGSEMSSQGIYLTAETYSGDHGYSLKLDGKSSTNSNARSRAIVIHPADYVRPGEKIGRSWGCPALDPRYSVEIINQIKGGAVLYAQ